MKKLILFLLIIISARCFAQDSVKITVTPQARDCEYIANFIAADFGYENMWDSLKVKFRVQNPPTGNTTVSFTAYTMDWIGVFERLNRDDIALKANCASRIQTLLLAVNQTYMTTKINAILANDQSMYSTGRQVGRFKLRRGNN